MTSKNAGRKKFTGGIPEAKRIAENEKAADLLAGPFRDKMNAEIIITKLMMFIPLLAIIKN